MFPFMHGFTFNSKQKIGTIVHWILLYWMSESETFVIVNHPLSGKFSNWKMQRKCLKTLVIFAFHCIFAIAKSALSDYYHPWHFQIFLFKGANIHHHCLLLTEWAVGGHWFNSSQTMLYFLNKWISALLCSQKFNLFIFSWMIYTVAVYLTGCCI